MCSLLLILLTNSWRSLHAIFRIRERGPINFQTMVPQSVLTQEVVQSICREYRIMSCDIICRQDITIDQLIDVIEVVRKESGGGCLCTNICIRAIADTFPPSTCWTRLTSSLLRSLISLTRCPTTSPSQLRKFIFHSPWPFQWIRAVVILIA